MGTPTEATPKAVVLENAKILALAGDVRFTSEFPFLNQVKAAAGAKKSGCSACAERARQRAVSAAVEAAKSAIAALPADRKRRLKEMLNAPQVRVYHGRVELTF